MNPTRSAKTTETKRLSPGSSTGLDAVLVETGDVSRVLPQLKQNLLEGSLTVPQFEHDRPRALPQFEQKEWSAGFSVPQELHVIIQTIGACWKPQTIEQ